MLTLIIFHCCQCSCTLYQIAWNNKKPIKHLYAYLFLVSTDTEFCYLSATKVQTITLSKIPKFHLTSWCINFAECKVAAEFREFFAVLNTKDNLTQCQMACKISSLNLQLKCMRNACVRVYLWKKFRYHKFDQFYPVSGNFLVLYPLNKITKTGFLIGGIKREKCPELHLRFTDETDLSCLSVILAFLNLFFLYSNQFLCI